MWIDLTQPFHGDVPHSAALPEPTLEELSNVETDGTNVQWIGTPTHVGTHVDAPRHFVPGGETIDEIPLERFEGRAAVIDVSRDEPTEISLSTVREAADGTVDADREVIALYTGWDDRYEEPSYHRYPWFAAEVGEWLLEQDVQLVCSDTPSPDRPREMRPEGWSAYPIHRTLLESGVLIAEHLRNLDALLGRDAWIQGFPMRIRGGDGAPARFVGRVEP